MAPLGSVLINGAFCDALAVSDRGLQYGDGIFTTLSVLAGAPLFLSEHLERLRRDAGRLDLPYPGDAPLSAEVRQLAQGQPAAVVKLILTRGRGGRGYRVPAPVATTRIVSLHARPPAVPEAETGGVTVRLCQLRLALQPRLAGVKHLNRLEQVLARAEWDDETIHEGLLQDADGWVVEGVMSNLFLVKNGSLHTPLLDRCGVDGVMRRLVLHFAAEVGLAVSETRLRLEDVLAADELFLTNSVIGIWPVGRFAQRVYAPGPVTQRLRAHLDARIMAEVAHACGV